MAAKILVGPLLGVEGECTYTFCFLSADTYAQATLTVAGSVVEAQEVGDLKGHKFWRAVYEVTVPPGGQGEFIDYTIALDEEVGQDCAGNASWRFYVPGPKEKPRIAYTSCNGASESGKLGPLDDAYDLWNRMVVKHDESPYSLLLMGGDQVYCDSIWQDVKSLRSWPELSGAEKVKKKAGTVMEQQLDNFYLNTIYKIRWGDRRMMHMMASVPSIMMWDDHDIFDGWGSFPQELQGCDVYQKIFRYAKKYFELFQVRSADNRALWDATGKHYSQSIAFRGCTVIALDNRSERKLDCIMESNHWAQLKQTLADIPTDHELYVMTAVPVVYRDFSAVETAMEATPWQESLEDDVLDHWRAKRHQGERRKLIMNLLSDAARRSGRRTVLLSGDVHVGCMGVITDNSGDKPLKIHQIVSSGIVHPAPSWIAWKGIEAVTNDKPEALNEDGTIVAKMVKTVGGDNYIRVQNYASLEPGDDGKVWVVWECKNGDRPLYDLA